MKKTGLLHNVFVSTLGWIGLLALLVGLLEWGAFFVGGQAALHQWESGLIPWALVVLQLFVVVFLGSKVENHIVTYMERRQQKKAVDALLAKLAKYADEDDGGPLHPEGA